MKQQILLSIGIFVLLVLTTFVIVEWSRPRVGNIILPAGGTYLGPSPKP